MEEEQVIRLKVNMRRAELCVKSCPVRQRYMHRIVPGVDMNCGHFVCLRCIKNGLAVIDKSKTSCLGCDSDNSIIEDIEKQARL